MSIHRWDLSARWLVIDHVSVFGPGDLGRIMRWAYDSDAIFKHINGVSLSPVRLTAFSRRRLPTLRLDGAMQAVEHIDRLCMWVPDETAAEGTAVLDLRAEDFSYIAVDAWTTDAARAGKQDVSISAHLRFYPTTVAQTRSVR